MHGPSLGAPGKASVVTPKPANGGQGKTGQRELQMSKNRVIAFSRTARADRLRNCFAACSRTWGPEVLCSCNFSFSSDISSWLIELFP
jgi:hypothetical protein